MSSAVASQVSISKSGTKRQHTALETRLMKGIRTEQEKLDPKGRATNGNDVTVRTGDGSNAI
jgi:hypothetical protein